MTKMGTYIGKGISTGAGFTAAGGFLTKIVPIIIIAFFLLPMSPAIILIGAFLIFFWILVK